ncbi:hypothetical protein [Streptomyces xylophagus]|nr:hypothetical protein [Streptomyces xylophagus]
MIPKLTQAPRTAHPAPSGFDRRLIAPMVLGSVLNRSLRTLTPKTT